MPGEYLPPVVTQLQGDASDLLSKIEEAKAAVRGLGQDSAKIKVGAEIDQASLAKAEAALKAATGVARDGQTIRLKYDVDTGALVGATVATKSMTAATRDTTAAVAGTNRALGTGNFQWLGLRLNLHWIVSGFAELLAVTIPAAAAFGTFAAAAATSVEAVVDHMNELNTVTKATNHMFGQTITSALGLGNSFSQMQQAVKPQVFDVLGGTLNAAQESMGRFGSTSTLVGAIFEEFAARVDVDLRGALGNQLHTAVAGGVNDLRQLGQVLGNLGHFILNVATDMPGLAEVLLRVADAVSRLLVWLTDPGWRSWIVLIGLGAEEFARWGSLLTSWTGRIILGLSKLLPSGTAAAKALESMGGGFKTAGAGSGIFLKTLAGLVVMNPELWVAGLAVGVGILALQLAKTKDSAEQWAAAMQKAVLAAGTNAQALKLSVNNINDLRTAMANVSDEQVNFQAASQKTIGTNQIFANTMHQNALAAQHAGQVYHQATGQQVQDTTNILLGATAIQKEFGGSLPQAMLIADAAGVKLANGFVGQSKSAQIARQQVENLARGYGAMGSQAGVLGTDLEVMGIQTGLADTKISQLNQGWDQFIQLSVNVTSSAASIQGSIQNMGQVTGGVKNALNATSSATTLSLGQIQNALKTFSSYNGQVWQNFDSTITTAEQYFDSLRTGAAAGVVSQRDFTQAVATTVQQLLPFASKSKAATSELSALVQEAGGPATGNFATLKAWVDKNAVSGGQYNTMLSRITQGLTNVTGVAKTFSSVIQTDVVNALANGQVHLSQITQLASNFNKTLQANHGPSTQATNDAVALYRQMTTLGIGTKGATQLIYQMAIQDGLTGQQANQLTNQVQNLTNKLNATPKNNRINETFTGSGSWKILFPGANKAPALTGATGGYIAGPGSATSDSIPARLSNGEYVVQAAAVAHYGRHLLDAVNTKRFAGGGIVGSFGQSGSNAAMAGVQGNLTNWVQNNTSATTNAFAAALAKNFYATAAAMMSGFADSGVRSASARAAMAFAAAALGRFGWGSGQMSSLIPLWNRESGWNAYAVNASSGAYGIPQSLGHGHPYALGDYISQVLWGLNYIRGRYGSPAGAWNHEVSYGWYDRGGFLPPGLSLAMNGTGKPEPVGAAAAGGGDLYADITVNIGDQKLYQAVQKVTLRNGFRNSGRSGLVRSR